MTGRAGRLGFGRFAVEAGLVVIGLVLIGWWPTQRVAGKAGIEALLAGCAVSLVASVVGGIPAVLMAGRSGADALSVMGACMALRLGLVAAGGLALALSGFFERGPLLIWLAISYAVLLAVDTRYLLKAVGGRKVTDQVSSLK